MSNSDPSTLPVKWDETARQGDDWLRQYRFEFVTDAGDTDILNTSGWTGGMAVKADIDDVSPLLTSPGDITVTPAVNGDEAATTTLASGASADDLTVSVSSATGIAVGQALVIELDDTSLHASLITDVAGTDITIASPVPSAAASSNDVTAYANAYCLEVFIDGGDMDTGGIVGVYDIELTDASSRDQTYLYGRFAISKEVYP